MTKNSVPIFSRWGYIYPGPHLDSKGQIDDRVWFGLPIGISDNNTITYLVFPHGGSDEEIQELVIDNTRSWID